MLFRSQSANTPRAVGSYGAIADNTAHVISGVLSNSESRTWLDGARMSTRVESTANVLSLTGAITIGYNISAGDYGNYSIGILTYYKDLGLSNSMRRRLEQASAFSFKIACN